MYLSSFYNIKPSTKRGVLLNVGSKKMAFLFKLLLYIETSKDPKPISKTEPILTTFPTRPQRFPPKLSLSKIPSNNCINNPNFLQHCSKEEKKQKSESSDICYNTTFPEPGQLNPKCELESPPRSAVFSGEKSRRRVGRRLEEDR